MPSGHRDLQPSLSPSSPYLKRPETNDQTQVLVSSGWEVLRGPPCRLMFIIYRRRGCVFLQAAHSDPTSLLPTRPSLPCILWTLESPLCAWSPKSTISVHSLPSLGVILEERFFWPKDARQMTVVLAPSYLAAQL